MANTRVSRAPDVLSERERRASMQPPSDAPPLQEPLAGYIFVCNNETMDDDLRRELFGLPQKYHESVRNIQPGMPVFLYNYTVHQLHGIFEACSEGGLNLDPTASKFPAQVRVRLREKRTPLDEAKFRPYLFHYDGPKFRLELSRAETNALLRLFGALKPGEGDGEGKGGAGEDAEGDWEMVKPKGRGLRGPTMSAAYYRGKRAAAQAGSQGGGSQSWRSNHHAAGNGGPGGSQGSQPGKAGGVTAAAAAASTPPPPPPPPPGKGKRDEAAGRADVASRWRSAQEPDAWSSKSSSGNSGLVSPDLSTTGTASSEERSTEGDKEAMAAECNGVAHDDACNGGASDGGSSSSGAEVEREGQQQGKVAGGEAAEAGRAAKAPVSGTEVAGEVKAGSGGSGTAGAERGSSGSGAGGGGSAPAAAWSVRSANVSFAAVLRGRGDDAVSSVQAGGSETAAATQGEQRTAGAGASAGVGAASSQSGEVSRAEDGVASAAASGSLSRPAGDAGAAASAAPVVTSAGAEAAGGSGAAEARGPPAGGEAGKEEAKEGKDVRGGAPRPSETEGGKDEGGWITVSGSSREKAGGRTAGAGASGGRARHTEGDGGKGGRGGPKRSGEGGGDRHQSAWGGRGRGAAAASAAASGDAAGASRGGDGVQGRDLVPEGTPGPPPATVAAAVAVAQAGAAAQAGNEAGNGDVGAEVKVRRPAWQGNDAAILKRLAEPDGQGVLAASAAAVTRAPSPGISATGAAQPTSLSGAASSAAAPVAAAGAPAAGAVIPSRRGGKVWGDPKATAEAVAQQQQQHPVAGGAGAVGGDAAVAGVTPPDASRGKDAGAGSSDGAAAVTGVAGAATGKEAESNGGAKAPAPGASTEGAANAAGDAARAAVATVPRLLNRTQQQQQQQQPGTGHHGGGAAGGGRGGHQYRQHYSQHQQHGQQQQQQQQQQGAHKGGSAAAAAAAAAHGSAAGAVAAPVIRGGQQPYGRHGDRTGRSRGGGRGGDMGGRGLGTAFRHNQRGTPVALDGMQGGAMPPTVMQGGASGAYHGAPPVFAPMQFHSGGVGAGGTPPPPQLATHPGPYILAPMLAPIAGYPAFPMPPPQFLVNAPALHEEILAYADEARPTREARLSAERAVWRVREAVQSLWKTADVEVFGSFATGLALPHSDVDVAVVNAPPPPIDSPELQTLSGARISAPLIRQLAAFLQKQPWCDSLYTIETARIPVIKLKCNAAYDPDASPTAASPRPSSSPAAPAVSSSEGAAAAAAAAESGAAKASAAPAASAAAERTPSPAPGLPARSPSPFLVPTHGVIGPAKQEIVKMDITIALSRPKDFVVTDDASKQLAAKLDDAAAAHNGAPARELVIERLKQFPALAPLVLLMKSFLHHRGLKDVYTGGLGSFSLTMMLVFYLERSPVSCGGPQVSLAPPMLPLPLMAGPYDPAAAAAAAAAAGMPFHPFNPAAPHLAAHHPHRHPHLHPHHHHMAYAAAAAGGMPGHPAAAAVAAAAGPRPQQEAGVGGDGKAEGGVEGADVVKDKESVGALADSEQQQGEGQGAEGREGDAATVAVSEATVASADTTKEASTQAAAEQEVVGSTAGEAGAEAGSGADGGDEGEDEGEASRGGSAARMAKGVVVDDLPSSASAVPKPNLGVLLLGFLHLFGQEMDLSKVRLVLRGKDGSAGGVFWQDPTAQPAALWIDDPLRVGANIGSGSFAMWHVQAAMREMLRMLTIAPLPFPTAAPVESAAAPSAEAEKDKEKDEGKVVVAESAAVGGVPLFPLLDSAFMAKLPVSPAPRVVVTSAAAAPAAVPATTPAVLPVAAHELSAAAV